MTTVISTAGAGTAAAMVPLALGVLLAWSGAEKLLGRSPERQAAGTALERACGGLRNAVRALRAVGTAELAVAGALLALPGQPVAGAAAGCLGAGFVGYLCWAKATAPESSCGCTAREDRPIGPRAFLRAGLVLAGGAVVTGTAGPPWWRAIPAAPLTSAVVLAVCAAAAALLFTEPDSYLLPLRRFRLHLLGHPLGGDGDPGHVPVEASVELLERSLAWEAASGIVRSGLQEHWDEDGWRFLLYTGFRDGTAASVLFALDATATVDATAVPAVRVTVVDDVTGRPVPDALPDLSGRRPLPLVT
ncbi:MauE/DoxX family redox-associated membrane protein [Streptomyces sp. TR02-1]|uniref:MauE/DoxX family redox-associated membrane protein n=1 Tax=Streptomyces sp. TR02-1 TaxID=3385977 RepID=UPI00399F4FA2